jgi:hypothetical protein
MWERRVLTFQKREMKEISGYKREGQQEAEENSIIRRKLICSPRQTTLG